MNRAGVALSLLLLTSSVFAETVTEKARALFAAGSQHYEAEEYTKALKAFEEAKALTNHPLMLFNIAKVYEAMEDLPNALKLYEDYLKTKPEDDSEAKERITRITRTLKEWATLDLKTTPPGVEIRLDDPATPVRAQTPVLLPVPPGQHTVFLNLAGHRMVKRPLKVKAKSSLKMVVSMPAVLPTVIIKTTPPGARLSFNGGRMMGKSPMTYHLKAGKHKVKIEKAGLATAEREFELKAGHTETMPLILEVALEKGIPKGQLAIFVNVKGADVILDGKPLGKSPVQEKQELAEGFHELSVTAAGREPYKESIWIRPNHVTKARVKLLKPGEGGSPTLALTLLGVGGAALLGGGITGIMATGTSGDLDDCRGDGACNQTQRELDLADDVRGQALTTDILMGTGLIVGGVGLLLYLSGGADGGAEASSQATSWGVMPTAEGLGAFGQLEF